MLLTNKQKSYSQKKHRKIENKIKLLQCYQHSYQQNVHNFTQNSK